MEFINSYFGRCAAGAPLKQLACEYKVSVSQISRIALGQRWTKLDQDEV